MYAKSRILMLAVSAVLALALCPGAAFAKEGGLVVGSASMTTQATAHTQDEAVAWANSQVGQALDFDRAYGAQCVDLTCYYYQYLGQAIPWGNAYQYVNGGVFCPSGWSYQGSPQPGDIAVWTGGSTGHVAIVTEIRGSQMVCVEQNYSGQMYCAPHLHNIDAQAYIRPDWPNPAPPVPATGSEMTSGSGRTIPDGDYAIVLTSTLNSDTFYWLDIAGSASPAADLTNVTIWGGKGDTSGLSDQDLWTVKYQDGFYTITQKGTDVALDVAGGSVNNGANVQVCSSNGTAAQKWAISQNGDGYRLEAKCSGYSLDLRDYNVSSGANVWVHEDNDSDAQRWSFVPVGELCKSRGRTILDGDYAIVLTSTLEGDSCYYLDIAGAEVPAASGTNVTIWSGGEKPGTVPDSDLWTVKYQDGFYAITQKGTDVALDVKGASLSNGANVQAHAANGSSAQKWAISENGDGYRLEAKCSGYSLDVYGYDVSNGANVLVHEDNDTAAQRWSFVPRNCDISQVSMSAISQQVYTGKPIAPKPSISWNGVGLVEGTDYTLSYKDNVNAGTATVTVTGKGGFTGSKSTTFKIGPASFENATVKLSSSSFPYDGAAKMPTAWVYLGETQVLWEGYDVRYSDNVNVGTATVTVTGKGNYTGEAKKTFAIVGSSAGENTEIGGFDNQPASSDLSSYAGAAKSAGFTDLVASDWYMSATNGAFPGTGTLYLDYAVGKGLMSGYAGTTRFAPGDNMSRAMVATVIYRMANDDISATTDPAKYEKNASGLADVADGQWYTAAVNWCVENGVITGYTSGPNAGRFCPGNDTTREELATIVGRYCTKVAGLGSSAHDVSRFSDAGSISGFAKEGVAFCAANGIVGGYTDGTGRFDPQGKALRCQGAKIFAVTARLAG